MTLQDLFTTVATLQKSVDKYQTKPTKAESKRIRMQLTQLRKVVPAFKTALMEADKAA